MLAGMNDLDFDIYLRARIVVLVVPHMVGLLYKNNQQMILELQRTFLARGLTLNKHLAHIILINQQSSAEAAQVMQSWCFRRAMLKGGFS